jgi:hypothetical protein
MLVVDGDFWAQDKKVVKLTMAAVNRLLIERVFDDANINFVQFKRLARTGFVSCMTVHGFLMILNR